MVVDSLVSGCLIIGILESSELDGVCRITGLESELDSHGRPDWTLWSLAYAVHRVDCRRVRRKSDFFLPNEGSVPRVKFSEILGPNIYTIRSTYARSEHRFLEYSADTVILFGYIREVLAALRIEAALGTTVETHDRYCSELLNPSVE